MSPTKIFISYAHADNKGRIKWLDEFKKTLDAHLSYQDIDLSIWDDTKIQPGREWLDEIEEELRLSSIFVILLSNNYLVSKFIKEKEFLPALERAKHKGLQIFTIAITSSAYRSTPLNNIQMVNDPDVPLASFTARNDRTRELNGIVEKLLTSSSSKTIGYHEHDRKNEVQENRNIHLLTSAKGGVGKTLLGLGIVCCYCDTNRVFASKKGLLAIDLNTMNPDLFNILDFESPKPAPLKKAADWWHVEIHANCRTVRRQAPHPHLLPKGAPEFWENLRQVISAANSNADVLVDTNLNPASLFDGTSDVQLQNLLNDSQNHLYIWLIWTWASLKDDTVIKRMLGYIPEDIRNRVTLVHVINPSAMVQPQIDVEYVRGILDEAAFIKSKIEQHYDFIKSYKQLGEKTPIFDEYEIATFADNAKGMKDAIAILASKLAGYFEKLAKLNEEIHPFEGLQKIVSEDCKPQVGYDDFVNLMKQFLEVNLNLVNNPIQTDFNSLYDMLSGNKPCNLFVIPSYDPNLRGYTDKLLLNRARSLNDISKQISHVQKELREFLTSLEKFHQS